MSRTDSFVRQAAWYSKQEPTFIDALALVRRHLWAPTLLQTSHLTWYWTPRKFRAHSVEYLRNRFESHPAGLERAAARVRRRSIR